MQVLLNGVSSCSYCVSYVGDKIFLSLWKKITDLAVVILNGVRALYDRALYGYVRPQYKDSVTAEIEKEKALRNWSQQEVDERVNWMKKISQVINSKESRFFEARLVKLTSSFQPQGMKPEEELQARAFIAIKDLPFGLLQMAKIQDSWTAHVMALIQYAAKDPLRQGETSKAYTNRLFQSYTNALALLNKNASGLEAKSDVSLWKFSKKTVVQNAKLKDIMRRRLYLALRVSQMFDQTEAEMRTNGKSYELIGKQSQRTNGSSKMNPHILLFKEQKTKGQPFYPFARIFKVKNGQHVQYIRFLGIKIIGEGSFNEAERGCEFGGPDGCRKVVYRRLTDQARKDQGAQDDFNREVKIAKALKGKANIIEIYHVVNCEDDHKNPRLGFLMQECDGDLDSLTKNPSLSPQQKLKLVKDILMGVAKMHEAGYVHSDLKLPNIFYTYDPILQEYKALIADFGLTKKASKKAYICEGGTPGYMPPIGMIQALAALQHSGRVDLKAFTIDKWALGMVLLEIKLGSRVSSWSNLMSLTDLFLKNQPFGLALENQCYMDLIQMLNVRFDAGNNPQFQKEIDRVIWNLLAQCWTFPVNGGSSVWNALSYLEQHNVTSIDQ